MALKLSKRISDTAWGDVDKTALGNKLATAYAAGDATKAQIRMVYLYVPDEAFGKDSDGKPTFAHSKAKMPIAEVDGSEIVINRNAVHAAAGAHGVQGADLPAADMKAAKRRMRGLYRKLKETAPDALKESIEKIERGQALEETVKGSVEYMLDRIRDAFEAAFKMPSPYYPGEMYCYYSIIDTFADSLVVRSWGQRNEEDGLEPDEFFKLGYASDGQGGYTFDPYDQWTVVELTYQPQTPAQSTLSERSESKKRVKGKRLDEALGAVLQLNESQDDNQNGPWKIKAIGITANVINGNGRRYSAEVLREAVDEARTHLTESFSQGRLVITGEPEHPRDKGTGRPTLLETVTNWTDISFDGTHVMLEGLLLGTSAGRDIHAQMIGGVMPDVSQRAKGDSHPVKSGAEMFEDVDWCRITGYDLVANGWGSDPEAGITYSESQDLTEGEDMTKEELIKFLAEHPELFKGVTKEQVESMNADALKAFEESVRKALGIDANADLAKELAEAAQAKKELTEAKQQKAVADAITEQTKGLKYGKALSAAFVEAIQAAKPKTADEVKVLVESKRVEYDKIAAAAKLAGMGFNGGGIDVRGPVLENELGTPEFARASHEITESLIRVGDPRIRRRNFSDPGKLSVNEIFAMTYLERYDKAFGPNLRAEAKRFEEAETTLDLDLPYSVMRAVVAQAIPELIATSIFDVGVTNASPFQIGYESFSGDTGYTVTVTDESVDLGDVNSSGYVALAHKEFNGASVVVTSSPAGTKYEEGVDFTIDYLNGRIYPIGALSGSTDSVLVDYIYTAVRKGEGVAIERAEVHLAWKTLDATAMRLAAQITREAIVFSRSQIGWDAVTRTITSLINNLRRRIDFGLMKLAREAATRQASNSGGSWNSAGTDYDVLLRAMGAAKVKVAKRLYTPTAYLMSTTISDLLANSPAHTAGGARADTELNANGYVMREKGLPVFASTEFDDDLIIALNREVVMHRVFLPMRLDGPHDAFDTSSPPKLLPNQEWYVEEFNVSETPVIEKAAYVTIS